MNKTDVINKLKATTEDCLFYENMENGLFAEFRVFMAQGAERIAVRIFHDLSCLAETVVPYADLALDFIEQYEDEALLNSLPGCTLNGVRIKSVELDTLRGCVYRLVMADGQCATFHGTDLRLLTIKGELDIAVWFGTMNYFHYNLKPQTL